MSTIFTRKPSKKQAEILEFVRHFQKENAYSPSLAEIADHFEISIPTVHQHVSHMRRKNLLLAQKGKRRSIQPLNDMSKQVVEIPMLGFIAAGGPIEAIRNPDSIEVPRNMLSKDGAHYALKVRGMSMVEEAIFEGDIIIVRQQSTVNDGEKAVAYLPDKNTVTLKKIYRDNGRIKLVPANREMRSFYEKNVEIQGRVIGVIRKEN